MSNTTPQLKAESQSKRKKVSTACLPCRKRKIRCDGRVPACLTCQIHNTTCAYDFERDSRKTPSKAYITALKARIVALERCLDDLLVAETVEEREQLVVLLREQRHTSIQAAGADVFGVTTPERGASAGLDRQKNSGKEDDVLREMTSLMTRLHVDNEGVIYAAGATSNIADMKPPSRRHHAALSDQDVSPHIHSPPKMGWQPVQLTPFEHHLIRLYFTWQHPVFYLFSPHRFLRDLSCGGGPCFSPLLLSIILAIGCHYTDDVGNSRGGEYFAQAKTLLASELERPSLTTCQALVMMGTREAGCGKDRGSGWLYSGMGFRMAVDLGIHLNSRELHNLGYLSAEAVEERELTFWGSFVADKCVTLHPYHQAPLGPRVNIMRAYTNAIIGAGRHILVDQKACHVPTTPRGFRCPRKLPELSTYLGVPIQKPTSPILTSSIRTPPSPHLPILLRSGISVLW